MALLVKNANVPRAAGVTGGGLATLSQFIHVPRPTGLLPQTTTDVLFWVVGGRILVHALLGEATTILTANDPGMSVNVSTLNAARDTIVGTTLVVASLEVGGKAVIEGDGTAIIKQTAGGVLNTATWSHPWIAGSQGLSAEIYITDSSTNTTGKMRWDLWYQPLDEGAYAYASPALAAVAI